MIGAPSGFTGRERRGRYVQVLDLVGGTWQQAGPYLDGAADDDFGWSVAMTSDGRFIAVGDRLADQVTVYSAPSKPGEPTSGWSPLGDPIQTIRQTSGCCDWGGYSVDVASDGLSLVVGTSNRDRSEGERDFEMACAYDFEGMSWRQRGECFIGEVEFDRVGSDVSLSADGSRLALTYTRTEVTRVFEYSDSLGWEQVGSDIPVETAGDFADRTYSPAVSLSGDGQRLAVGALSNDAGEQDVGHVRIFELT